MIYFGFYFVFLLVWLIGVSEFIKKRNHPSLTIRRWNIRMISNIYILIYLTVFVVCLEQFYANGDNNFTQFCPSFTFFQYMCVPVLSSPAFIMQYNWHKTADIERFAPTWILQKPILTALIKKFFDLGDIIPMSILIYIVSFVFITIPYFVYIYNVPTQESSDMIECYGALELLVYLLAICLLFIHYSFLTFKKQDNFGVQVELYLQIFLVFFSLPVSASLFIFYLIYNIRLVNPFLIHIAYMVGQHIFLIWLPIFIDYQRTKFPVEFTDENLYRLLKHPTLRDTFLKFIEEEMLTSKKTVDLFEKMIELEAFTGQSNFNEKVREVLPYLEDENILARSNMEQLRRSIERPHSNMFKASKLEIETLLTSHMGPFTLTKVYQEQRRSELVGTVSQENQNSGLFFVPLLKYFGWKSKSE